MVNNNSNSNNNRYYSNKCKINSFAPKKNRFLISIWIMCLWLWRNRCSSKYNNNLLILKTTLIPTISDNSNYSYNSSSRK